MVEDSGRGPHISVCMAAHNGEKYVEEQIASILPQLGEHDELVIVDDCSTDNTVSEIRAIADPRIRLIAAEKNVGYVRTFERALREALGDVIFLSDQDDVWTPGRVESMLRGLADRLMVVGNCEHFGGAAGHFQEIRLRPGDSDHHLRNIVGILVGYRLHWGCAMAFRRELLDTALPFPRFLRESHDQYLALDANVNGSVRYLDSNVVRHRLHGENLTPAGVRGLPAILRARLAFVGELLVLCSRRALRRPSKITAEHEGSRRKVAVVVSCFNPPLDLVERAAGWVREVGPVIAVDDGSPHADPRVWSGLEAAGVEVLHQEHNSGIAAALNAGVHEALARFEPDWVLNMDQDSSFGPDYVASAFKALDAVPRPERVGMLSSESQNGVPLRTILGKGTTPESFDPMQSGTLMRVEMIRAIGWLDESLFIDAVDSDYNARARRHGWVLLAAKGCDLNHTLGTARPMTVLGHRAHYRSRALSIYYHPPFRVYYLTRNNVVLARRYFWNQPLWIVRRIAMELEGHIVRFTFGPDRRENLVAVGHGVVDGLTGRTGRIDPVLLDRIAVHHSPPTGEKI